MNIDHIHLLLEMVEGNLDEFVRSLRPELLEAIRSGGTTALEDTATQQALADAVWDFIAEPGPANPS